MFRIIAFVAAAAALSLPAPAAGLRDYPIASSAFSISDGGVARSFDVADDEVGSIGRDGRGAVHPIARQPHAEAVRRAAGAGRDLLLYEKGRPHTEFTRRWLTARVLVKLADGADAKSIAATVGASRVELPAYAPGLAIFDAPEGAGNALVLAGLLRAQPGVESAEPLLARQAKKRFTPNDPLFSDNAANAGYQWHLQNTGARGGTAGIDLNVTAVWDTFRGAGVLIGILDDGLDLSHPDLSPNIDLPDSHDFNDGDSDPSPAAEDTHGTPVAGLAAARGNNGIGGSGVAPEASLAGLRLLGGPQSDAGDASAFAWKNDVIAIKSNSWGPDDDGATISGPGTLANAAIQDAISTGRGGKGAIFCWAGGNGGTNGDNSNFDGYANSTYTLAFGAVTDAGKRSSYSEQGANLTAVAPSDGGAQMITSTDLHGADGYNNGYKAGNYPDGNYTDDFGGTSTAAPLAAGVVALMLQENPDLGWRDVQEILIRSARKNDAADSDWAVNGAGFHFNHKYGAGLLDASAAVALAAGWTNLGPVTTLRKLDVIPVNIPDAPSNGVSKTFVFGATEGLRVERATVTVSVTHAARGTLEIDLTSPGGMVSRLATQRPFDTGADLNWTFSTVRHWGESAVGTWTVTVRDKVIGTVGALNRVTLELHGSSATGTSAPAINSSTTASGNAGSPFGFQITANNAPTSYAVTGLPAGLSVNATTGFIGGVVDTPGSYPVTVSATNAFGTGTGSLTISLGANLVASLADALDQPSLPWDLDLANAWTRITGASPTTHDGIDAARSATIADNGSTSFSVIVLGPQVVRFWWKVSSEQGFDFLHFALDGLDQAAISGTVDWQQRGFVIPAGSHELRWTYDKDVSDSAGSDAGWVDEVALTPFDSSRPVFITEPVSLTVGVGGITAFVSNADGPGPITYQWQRNGSDVGGATSRTYTITSTAALQAGNYTCLATNGFGTTTSLTAVLTVPVADANIANAVDAPGLVWTKFGSAPQFVRTVTLALTHDNVDSAIATGLAKGATTNISTTVIGPGTLGFWWRSDGTLDEDVLGFNLDGVEAAYTTSTGGWVQVSQSIPSGIHTLSWTYYAGSAGSGTTGRGILDQVTYTLTPFGSWQAAQFSSAQRVDFNIAGPNADPDVDGTPNLAEYFFGTSPNVNSTAGLPVLAREGSSYTLTYQHDTTATTATRTIEHSADLYNWETVTAAETIISTIGTVQTIKATLPPVTGPNHYYRIRIGLSE